MGTSKEDIKRWLKQGKKEKATHVIVVCDTFDYEDYPVYVMKNEDVHKVYDEHNGKNMQRVMEVYNLSKDIDEQLNTRRAFNF